MKTKKLLLLIGGILLMTTLSGCRMMAERGFKDLGEVYPTENIYHLFAKFPKGFTLYNFQYHNDETFYLTIEGDEKTKTITGTLEIVRDVDNSDFDDVMYETELTIDANSKLVPSTPPPAEYQSYLDNFFFLFQKLDLSSEKLSSFSLDETGSNTNSTHWIWYTVNHPELATYLKSKGNNIFLHLERQAGGGVWGFEKIVQVSTKEVAIREKILSEGKINGK